MSKCKIENWTLAEVSTAIQNNHKDNKIIVVPMFQRGKRWDKNQQQIFIDSLMKGYPVGTLLFYEKYENNQWNYVLVDGLQRSNCIRGYLQNPTEFFFNYDISDEFCDAILNVVEEDNIANRNAVRNILTNFIKQQKSFKNIQFYAVAHEVCEKFDKQNDANIVKQVIDIIAKFFADKQELYETISTTSMPIEVYSGPEETLPEIFERINSKGTPLDQYEIYAATWPISEKFTINNAEIIEYVVKKYDSLANDGYTMHGYDREKLRKERSVTAFEYLFGLSRYLVNKFEILAFRKNTSDDVVNPLAFELINACLNDTDRIYSLYKNLRGLDINALETALITAIEFVSESISMITKFKGNAHNAKKYFILNIKLCL